MTARDGEQTITLPQILRITGKVTDAATGRPILNVTAIPVLEFGPGHLITERNGLRTFSDGTYTIEGDRTDVAYRVRIEAAGYRSAISEPPSAPGLRVRPWISGSRPRRPWKGGSSTRAVNPVKDARVYLATGSEILMNNVWEDDDGAGPFQRVLTGAEGRFSFPAQFERYAIVAVHDSGYAEVQLEPDQQPGELTLKDWAHVEGRLLQAGSRCPTSWVTFSPDPHPERRRAPHPGHDVREDRPGRPLRLSAGSRR